MKLKDIQINLLDINPVITQEWQREFGDLDNVKIVNSTLKDYLDNNFVEAVVSPANSFGLMDGGYDYYLTEYFGVELMHNVKQHIIDNYGGLQPVGTSFMIDIPDSTQAHFLIHSPTMEVPMNVQGSINAYLAMRSTLLCALERGVSSILIPSFGTGAGNIQPCVAAKQMRTAYNHVNEWIKHSDYVNWKFASQKYKEIVESFWR